LPGNAKSLPLSVVPAIIPGGAGQSAASHSSLKAVLPHDSEQVLQVPRRLDFELEHFATVGVAEFKLCGVQRLALETAQFRDKRFAGTRWQRKAATIDRVADESMTTVRKMNPDLVGSTCFQLHSYKSMRSKSLEYRVMSDSWLAVITNTHALAVDPVTTDCCVNSPATGKNSIANRQVETRYISVCQ
jgi:hypothetical protein